MALQLFRLTLYSAHFPQNQSAIGMSDTIGKIKRRFDIIWLQSVPAISRIFYHKYLRNTFTLLPLQLQSTPRGHARQIQNALKSTETGKVAVMVFKPFNQEKIDSIFKLVRKNYADLSCFCISIPTQPNQLDLLLGWAVCLDDPEWKNLLIQYPYDQSFFEECMTLTKVAGRCKWTEFASTFVVSKEIFSKQALVLDLRANLIDFDYRRGINFKNNLAQSIRGYIAANDAQPRTMVWIIDEKVLFGDSIYAVKQEKRACLLKTYRNLVQKSVQSFESPLPIYLYVIDYYSKGIYNLQTCMLHLQHRHALCMSKSILLAWSEDSSYDSMRSIYLKERPEMNAAKWRFIFQNLLEEVEDFSQTDLISYIHLDEISFPENSFRTPLLTTIEDDGSLTKTEAINDEISHSVIIESVEAGKKWTSAMTFLNTENAIVTPANFVHHLKEVQPSTPKPSNPTDLVEHISKGISSWLTMSEVIRVVNNEGFIKSGEKLRNGVDAVEAFLISDSAKLGAQIKAKVNVSGGKSYQEVNLSILDETKEGEDKVKYRIDSRACTCPIGNWGCKHFAAVLLYLLEHDVKVTLQQSKDNATTSERKRSFSSAVEEDDEYTVSEDGSSSAGSKKRQSSSHTAAVNTIVASLEDSSGHSLTTPSLPSISEGTSTGKSASSYSYKSSSLSMPTSSGESITVQTSSVSEERKEVIITATTTQTNSTNETIQNESFTAASADDEGSSAEEEDETTDYENMKDTLPYATVDDGDVADTLPYDAVDNGESRTIAASATLSSDTDEELSEEDKSHDDEADTQHYEHQSS